MVTGEPQGGGRIGPKSDRDLTNAEKTIFTLKNFGLTICTAESMTAGGLGYYLTRVPGSSQVFMGGIIVYTREMKSRLLNIPEATLNMGLVTPTVARAMAEAAMEKIGTNFSAAITGNAGPTTDGSEGSVGEVHLCLLDDKGNADERTFNFAGSRDDVRAKAVTESLRALRNFVEEIVEFGSGS